MTTPGEVRNLVRSQYNEIAVNEPAASSCCSSKKTCCSGVSKMMADNYHNVAGYNADADLGLGCGLPTKFAHIKPGDTVLDLGSGAGNDCFVARSATGFSGKVIGVDFTPSMVERARKNAERRGFDNVKFLHGDIEDLPVPECSVNVVVSNCVLNLVPNKTAVFREIMRALHPGGHFSISDIVLEGPLPEKVRSAAAAMYAGCVSRAMQMEDYLALIPKAGFRNMTVQKKKPIVVPEDTLLQSLSREEVDEFYASGTGIFSITVYAEKPECE